MGVGPTNQTPRVFLRKIIMWQIFFNFSTTCIELEKLCENLIQHELL